MVWSQSMASHWGRGWTLPSALCSAGTTAIRMWVFIFETWLGSAFGFVIRKHDRNPNVSARIRIAAGICIRLRSPQARPRSECECSHSLPGWDLHSALCFAGTTAIRMWVLTFGSRLRSAFGFPSHSRPRSECEYSHSGRGWDLHSAFVLDLPSLLAYTLALWDLITNGPKTLETLHPLDVWEFVAIDKLKERTNRCSLP